MVIDLAPYFPAAWLRITGEDAPGYLQGQASRDLQGAGGEPVYTLLLDHKGKIQADAFVGRTADGFWACSYQVDSGALRTRLEAFIVADNVVIEDQTAEIAGISLFGAGARESLEEARRALGLEGTVFAGRRAASENWEWVLPRADRDNALRWLSSRAEPLHRQIDADELEWRRIEGRRVAIPADAGPRDLPQEAGLGEDAVSYAKGCYVGQEVMARLKTRGRVRRRLRRFGGTGIPPPRGSALYREGQKVGESRSTAVRAGEFIGWAMIGGELPPGTRLRAGSADGVEIALTDE